MDENILLQLRFDKLKEEYTMVKRKYKRSIVSIFIMFFLISFFVILISNGLSFTVGGIKVLESLVFGLLIASLIQLFSTINDLDRYKSDLRTNIFELYKEMNSKGIVKMVDENQEFIEEIKII